MLLEVADGVADPSLFSLCLGVTFCSEDAADQIFHIVLGTEPQEVVPVSARLSNSRDVLSDRYKLCAGQ